ncbi:MAG TPA: nucleotide-binding protein [Thermoanaerobaculia bacterium]|nr:nucleotide-binding protein [Thermoanaerobaculia bacterium]
MYNLDMAKPSLFVGSSTEGLEFARAIRALLTDVAQITLWNEGFFRPGGTFIDTLVNALPRFDFAALVLTADDLVRSRDVEAMGPRDNVLFELGLFMGRLGRQRTFLVHQLRADLKIPSDLSGVTAAEYEWPRDDKNYRAAVGAACDGIRQVIQELGPSEAKTARAITDLSEKQEQQERQLSEHRDAIRFLQVALQGIVTNYEFDKLQGLDREGSFLCYYSDDLFNEMKRLRAMGLVTNYDGMGLGVIRAKYKDRDERFDMKRYFFVTDQGREYLRLRREVMRDEP